MHNYILFFTLYKYYLLIELRHTFKPLEY